MRRFYSVNDDARLTVYTTPTCGDCIVTKRWLRDRQVAYREVDITYDAEAQATVRSLARGYRSTPTLVFDDGTVLVEPGRRELDAALERLGLSRSA